ncbi:MAG: tRNA (adenine-N1)-methyltransferase [Anaerolineae bacterium]|nr:tRNA (adenine-N1)-methyltransferase [Anaerolineae bacterium]
MTVLTEAGDLVLLVGEDRKSFIRPLQPGDKLQTHRGEVLYDDLIGLPYGSEIRTHLGHRMFMLAPTTSDLILDLRRQSQIMFPKDLGYAMIKMGIQPGHVVAEAGTGSGGLTLALATLVGADGHVFSYDRRADMQKLARANLRKAGLEARATFKLRDIADGLDETDLDAMFLDVTEPWEYLAPARAALAGGGCLGILVPTINQVQTLVDALYDSRAWFMIEVEETFLRGYKTVPQRIRPEDRMIAHTGYLIFARAVTRLPEAEAETEELEAEDAGAASVESSEQQQR